MAVVLQFRRNFHISSTCRDSQFSPESHFRCSLPFFLAIFGRARFPVFGARIARGGNWQKKNAGALDLLKIGAGKRRAKRKYVCSCSQNWKSNFAPRRISFSLLFPYFNNWRRLKTFPALRCKVMKGGREQGKREKDGWSQNLRVKSEKGGDGWLLGMES